MLTPYIGGSMLSSSKSTQMGYFENEFGIDDKMCQMLLEKALSRGGDFADIYFEHSLDNWLTLEDGKVNRSSCNVLLGVGIRTVKGDQIGYGFTQDLTEESMLSAAATAASLVNESAGKVAENLNSLKTENYYPFDPSMVDIPLQSKLPLVKATNDKCFAFMPQRLVKRMAVQNSHGIILAAEEISLTTPMTW